MNIKYENGRVTVEMSDVQIVIFNHLFGIPLYAWWLIILSVYEQGEIEGTLLDDLRQQMHGPFEGSGDALEWLMKQQQRGSDN